MTINDTLNYLLARRTKIVLPFSAQVTTASTYLKGGGGESGDGTPVPRGGRLIGLQVWDGLALKSASDELALAAGDRVSLYATYGAGTFTVTARINGLDSTLAAGAVGPNTTLFASLELILG